MMAHPYKEEVSLKTLDEGEFLSNRIDPATKNTNCEGSVKVEKVKEGKEGSFDENTYKVYLCCTNYQKMYTYPDGEVKDIDDFSKCDANESGPDDYVIPEPLPGEVTYNITYNLNGGTVTGNPDKYSKSMLPFTIKNPTRSGYTFTGWTGSNGTTAQKTVTISKGTTGNKTYTANWNKNTTPVDPNKTYKCSAGNYLPANKTSCATCTSANYCPGGTWKISTKNQGINPCPNGYKNSNKGSSKITQCFRKVEAGYYLAKKQATSNTICPANKYKEAHNVYYNSTSSCTNCPSGFGKSSKGSTSINSCYKTVTATFTFNAGKYHNLSIEKSGKFKDTKESCNLYYSKSGCLVKTPKCRFGTSGNSKDVDLNNLFTCKFNGVVAGGKLSINSTGTHKVSVTANSAYVGKTSKTYALSGSKYDYSVIRNSKDDLYSKGTCRATNYGHIKDKHPFNWDGSWMVDNKSGNHYLWLHVKTVKKETKCITKSDSQDCGRESSQVIKGWLYSKLIYY